MLGIRFAGQKIRDFDDAYAAKVMDSAGKIPGVGVIAQMIGGLPITYKTEPSPATEIAMDFAREGKGPASKGQVQRHQAIERAFGESVRAANAGVRYGLPAAGVALAGKGIYDLAAGEGNGELPM